MNDSLIKISKTQRLQVTYPCIDSHQDKRGAVQVKIRSARIRYEARIPNLVFVRWLKVERNSKVQMKTAG
jgi:hypothetical protein